MRKIFWILIVLVIFAIPPKAFAQALPATKDTTTTLVGNAVAPSLTPGALPVNPTGSTAVAYWANIMASQLEPNNKPGNTNGWYTSLNSPITNPVNGETVRPGDYVCTDFVIATHRLAGQKVPHQTLVRNMQENWESATGGNLINYTQNNRLISYVRAGDVFFQRDTTSLGEFVEGVGHVSIISQINVDSNGDGTMIIKEANVPRVTQRTLRFTGWKMLGYNWSSFNAFFYGLHLSHE